MKMDEKDYLEETFRKEVLKSMDEKLTKKQKEELLEEARVSLDFLEKVSEVELPNDNYVIFTDGKEQLVYENGEFYVVSATDSLKQKKKKTKKEATDMYLDFFIKYQLNPILDARQNSGKEQDRQKAPKTKEPKQQVQENIKETQEVKEASNDNIKEELKNEVKEIEDEGPSL